MILLIVFYLWIDGQIEYMNQKLEQYLWMFIDYCWELWQKQLRTAEFVYNNKVHSVTKIFPFKTNYGQNPQIGFEIRRKEKFEKVDKFVKKRRKYRRRQKENIKEVVDGKHREAEEYKMEDLVLLSTKNLKCQIIEQRMEKLTENFVGLW